MKAHYIKRSGMVLFLMLLVSFSFSQPKPELFQQMKARSIGPAGMSGRIADIEALATNPDVIYVGSATGGLWRSSNGGTTWEPLFDDQPVSSIGAVAVHPQNHDIIWAGTGEGNPRNSVGVGYGIYKSVDGGRTWESMGLEKTEKIHRILLHPKNPDIAYVAALGTTWGENPERGVYKTTDGGKTWEKILFINEKTGCADLIMDPQNPDKLFAAMWQHRRWPWFFESGGPGSGLYRTYDGGENWQEIDAEDGLPEGELGRIGLAISGNRPEVVYALVEAKKNVLCRSEDGGHSWKVVNKSEGVNSRPFYYADIYVDPQNENRIYSLQSHIQVSEDGGRNFRSLRSGTHSDHHAFWIHPQDGSFMIDGSDGGVAISRDMGRSWRFVENLPLAQYYHISADNELPYHIYGGMQDNGSWRGPNTVWERGGVANYHWKEVGFGDGFATLSDPENPKQGYSMSQQGYLMRFNIETGELKDIRPPSPNDTTELRFNWNAAIALDPFDPSTIYFGSQFVHKSTDKGESWQIISGDLTTNNPEWQKQDESGGLTYDVTGAENFTTLFALAPSPVKKGVLWAGSDDGQVQLTTDGGATWINVVDNIPDLPDHTWCSHIEASPHDAATAYITFDDHRRSNWETYVYKTEDYGKSWKKLTQHNPVADKPGQVWGFAHAILQDPVEENLLFLGTEFGLWISFNDGQSWMKWTHGVPTVPVRDMVIQEREDDLVLGTHGRAAFVLDNIQPLREATKDLENKKLRAFPVPNAWQHETKEVTGYHFPADAIFKGDNEPYGAMINYYIHPDLAARYDEKTKHPKNSPDGKSPEKKVLIKIYDQDTTLVRELEQPVKKGINRFYWDLRSEGHDYPSWEVRNNRRYSPSGPEVVPGTYLIEVNLGEHQSQSRVTVRQDPKDPIPLAERKAQYHLLQKMGNDMQSAKKAVDQLRETHQAIEDVLKKMQSSKDTTYKDLIREGKDLQKKLKKTAALLVSMPDEKQGITRQKNVMRKYYRAYRSLTSSYEAPNETQQTHYRQAQKELTETFKAFNELFTNEVEPFKNKIGQMPPKWFKEFERIEI